MMAVECVPFLHSGAGEKGGRGKDRAAGKMSWSYLVQVMTPRTGNPWETMSSGKKERVACGEMQRVGPLKHSSR